MDVIHINSIKTIQGFKDKMNDELEFMVTPIVFDIISKIKLNVKVINVKLRFHPMEK